MAKGRPPELFLDPEGPGPVVQSVVSVDDRGRFQLPSRVLGGWITKGAATFALAVLTEPGRVTLHAWKPAGSLVLQRRRELIEQASLDEATIEILRALEDRYKRFQIPISARPTLTAEMISHLGFALNNNAPLYVWRIRDIIELNSASYRVKELGVDWEVLADLPG
jgi:hypothetical protein